MFTDLCLFSCLHLLICLFIINLFIHLLIYLFNIYM